MGTSLLMSKIIDLTAARRKRVVHDGQLAHVEREQRKEYRKPSDERLFVQVVECSDSKLVGTTLSCHVKDASGNGLRVVSEQYIPEGSHLDLWVDNKARPGKFFLTSDVRWIQDNDDDRFEFGVELHDGAATDIDNWRKAFASL